MESPLNNISIVLVRPEFVGNIGSVARVMKNFGIEDLRLVGAPRNYKDSESRKMSVGAFDILKKAQLFDSIEKALESINLSIALSSGRQRSRQLSNLSETVTEVAQFAKANTVALVFGNERNGLLDEELAHCTRKVRIESSAEFPSLNVSQAVGVVAYSLSSSIHLHTEQPSLKEIVPELPTSKDIDELFGQVEILIEKIDFAREHNKGIVLSELKDAYNRMDPTRRELSLLKGILFKLNSRLD